MDMYLWIHLYAHKSILDIYSVHLCEAALWQGSLLKAQTK